MNYASPATLAPDRLLPLAESCHPLERSLLTQIEALQNRLDSFTVVDATGETLGEIRNLVLYKRRLHLVIVQPDVHKNWRFVLLSSHLVQRVSLRDRTIAVHTTHADLSYLPEQRSAATRASLCHYASTHASVMVPVSQLPASLPTDRMHEAAEPSMVLLEPIALKPPGKVKVPLMIETAAMPKVVADMVDASGARSFELKEETDAKPLTPAYPARHATTNRSS